MTAFCAYCRWEKDVECEENPDGLNMCEDCAKAQLEHDKLMDYIYGREAEGNDT